MLSAVVGLTAQPGFVRVLIVLLGVGGVLGVAEIAAPAAVAEHGQFELRSDTVPRRPERAYRHFVEVRPQSA